MNQKYSAAASLLGMDAVASLSMGVQVYLRPAPSLRSLSEEEKESYRDAFISVAAGAYVPANEIRHSGGYGAFGRLSYGRWYNAHSAWRVNFNGQLNPRTNEKEFALFSVGGDYLFDMFAFIRGYNENRLFSLRPLGGLAIGGAEYKENTGSHFVADVHVGVQTAFRVSPQIELYLEPQLAYCFDGRNFSGRSARFTPSLLGGVNYHFKRSAERSDITPEHARFFSFAIGTGLHNTTMYRLSSFS